MATSEINGAAPAPVMVRFGPADDDFVTVTVAGKMLAALLEREDKLFTVLLGEAYTGVRLARTLHRATPAELAERALEQAGA